MSPRSRAIASALNLRKGEGPLFIVLGSYLFLATATTTLLVAVKNGLFLSVYPASVVPYAMIMAALLTAAVSVAFSGFAARETSRDLLARALLATLAASFALSWSAFRISPRSAFAIYLWLVSANVLLLTQAWSYVAGSLTGRQAKRLMPIIGIGGSVASIVTGVLVGPLVLVLGTENLLFVAAALLLGAIPLLGRVTSPQPEEGEEPEREDGDGVKVFLRSSLRGIGSLRKEPLLRLLAGAVVLIMITSTLIDFQFKIAVQESFERDRITAVYGLLAGGIGVAALLLQLSTSRFIFPKFGISAAAMGHAGTLALNAGAVAATGGLSLLFLLQVLDDSLRFSIERPAEQVSLLPFPRRIKEPAYTTISGVLRPLARALTAWGAIFLAMRPISLPIATLASALGAMLLYTRHRRLYLGALEDALARHSVELAPVSRAPLVVDKGGLKVIDEALVDPEPTVVIFALSLLPRIPAADALPLLLPRLEHRVPEVRAEAARVLGAIDEEELSEKARWEVLQRLERERDPMVLSALVTTLGGWSGDGVERTLVTFLDHAHVEVRKHALLTLGKRGWEGTQPRLMRMLSSEREEEQIAGTDIVGELGFSEFLPTLAMAAEVDSLRPSVLHALGRMGSPAVPVLVRLASDRRIELSVRRSLVGTLAAIDDTRARAELVDFLWNADLAPAALRELRRLRHLRHMEPLDRRMLAPILRRESEMGLRYALAGAILVDRAQDGNERLGWVTGELSGLRDRRMHRVMDVLSLSYDPERVRAVEEGLASGESERQSSALELLEGMLEYEEGALAIPLCETVTEGGGVASLAAQVVDSESLLGGPLEVLRQDEEWFPRALAIYALAGADGGEGAGALNEEEKQMIPLIEKVMILKGSELFRDFPGEELAGVASLAKDAHLSADEVLFKQGDPGDAFYMVVRGAVRIVRDGHQLAVLGPREGFGEMAILDHDTRSATVQAAEPTTLLRIDQDAFDRLVDRNPAIAKGIYRVLSRRLRATLAQVGGK